MFYTIITQTQLSKNYLKIFILGSIFYILLHFLLFRSNNVLVCSIRKYFYGMFLIDMIASFLIFLFTKKSNDNDDPVTIIKPTSEHKNNSNNPLFVKSGYKSDLISPNGDVKPTQNAGETQSAIQNPNIEKQSQEENQKVICDEEHKNVQDQSNKSETLENVEENISQKKDKPQREVVSKKIIKLKEKCSDEIKSEHSEKMSTIQIPIYEEDD